jgi:hypothetical protein
MAKTLFFVAALLTCINAMAQKFDTDTLLYNGNSAKHINFVILSDGYTVSELSKFETDASNLISAYFNVSPYLYYKNYFNVFIIKVPSDESGASHPGTATDVTEPVFPVSTVNNYFGSEFDYGGIHRLLVATKYSAIINVLAANFPDYDQALILVNSPYYGGSGGGFSVASTHTLSAELAEHEIGHSFTGLSDEYWAGDIYAAESVNMTQQTNPSLVRWKNWMGINMIGIYQHCCSVNSLLWYKPHQNCKMQFLGSPFCSVCIQATVEKIHSLVTPVESYYPIENNITTASYPIKFKMKCIVPAPNTLKRNWSLNGTLIKKNIDSVFISENALVTGINTLNATVEDTTQLIKVDNHTSIHLVTVTWKINRIVTGIRKIESSSSDIKIEIYPNPVSDMLYIKLSGELKNNITLEIYDMQGRRQKKLSLSPDGVNSLDVQDLNQGVYFAKIFIDDTLITTRKIIRE